MFLLLNNLRFIQLKALPHTQPHSATQKETKDKETKPGGNPSPELMYYFRRFPPDVKYFKRKHSTR